MKPSNLQNLSSYKQTGDFEKAEEPLIQFNVEKKKVKKDVLTLLEYEGVGDIHIPGSFLSVVTEITSLPVSLLIDILDISKSTYYRVKDEKQLEQQAIDKLASILKIYNRGLKAFNDKEDFYTWLQSKVPALANQRPLELLKTENGRMAVLEAIDRIEYGVYG